MTGRRAQTALATMVLVGALASCGEHRFEPPDREAQVAQADTVYSTVHFDTVQWQSDSVRAFQGNVVYSARCRQCHGAMGSGDTDYARARNLAVPSLVDPGWEPMSVDSLRHIIFIGHASGMPTWGIAGITPREIDAAAYYILDQLRPDVLGGGEPEPSGG